MTDYHIKKFESNKYFNDAVKLRELEDTSKQPLINLLVFVMMILKNYYINIIFNNLY